MPPYKEEVKIFTVDFSTTETGNSCVNKVATGVWEADLSSRTDVVGKHALCRWISGFVDITGVQTTLPILIATNLSNSQSLNTKHNTQSNVLCIVDKSNIVSSEGVYIHNYAQSEFMTVIPDKLRIEKRLGVNQTLISNDKTMILKLEFKILPSPETYLN